MTREKIYRYLLIFSLCYFGFHLAVDLTRFNTHIALTSNRLDNIISLGSFIFPLMPFLWFLFIKQRIIKVVLYVTYICCLIPLYLTFSLAILFTLNDVITNNGNGFRPVFEINTGSEERLVMYRTPDKGALGGDFIVPYVVHNIMPGIISRKPADDFFWKRNYSDGSQCIEFNGVTYRIPGDDVLRTRGNLKEQ